ncbi:hypothetical protein AAHE18_18G160200 [Arachis hypogaea]
MEFISNPSDFLTDVVEDSVTSLKCKTPTRRALSGVKHAVSLNIDNEKYFQLSTNKLSQKSSQKRQKMQTYLHMGDAMYEYEHCNALFWYDEKSNKNYNTSQPKFTLCCKGRQVQVPHLQEAPKVLYELLYGNGPKSKHFRKNIRSYNSMFQFTSMGAKIDRGRNNSRGPPTFILFGENYHLMGSFIPPEGSTAKFAQLYVFDTQNEVQNRMAAIRFVIFCLTHY